MLHSRIPFYMEMLSYPHSFPYVKYANMMPARGVSTDTTRMMFRMLKGDPLYSEPSQLSVYKSLRSCPLFAARFAARRVAADIRFSYAFPP